MEAGWCCLPLLLLLLTTRWGDGHECDSGCAPVWEIPVPSIRSLNRLVGESANFRCRAFGYPRPYVTWVKDSRPLTQHDGKVTFTHDGVGIVSLEAEDGGIYSCLVQNTFGSIHRTIQLSVYETKEVKDKEELIRPLNMTSHVGESVTFWCDVDVDDVDVTVTWVRETRSRTSEGEQRKSQVVKTGVYIEYDELVLVNVTQRDSGRYTCILNTTLTTTQRVTWLSVLPTPGGGPRTDAVLEAGLPRSTSPLLAYLEVVGTVVAALAGIALVAVLVAAATALFRSWRKLSGDNSGTRRLQEETVDL